jgi:hypothetical protein
MAVLVKARSRWQPAVEREPFGMEAAEGIPIVEGQYQGMSSQEHRGLESHKVIKYFSTQNVEKTNLLEEKSKDICLKVYY